jgi:trans-aconitate methyltransferase
MRTEHLCSLAPSIRFYDDRFRSGYMDDWPREKKDRISDLVKELPLPPEGVALDFGCGTGVFTEVLRTALPRGWTVVGSDLSDVAVGKARQRFPACTFMLPSDPRMSQYKFGFVFSHHVLEHVYDLAATLGQIDELVADGACALHVLPCGNEGSFEYSVCATRRDGIDAKLGNRYFYEDEGHVRRLRSRELESALGTRRWSLERSFYANQREGAVNWITKTSPSFILRFADPSATASLRDTIAVSKLRRSLLLLWASRFPASFIESRLLKRKWSAAETAVALLCLPLYPFAKPLDVYLRTRARHEWRCSRDNPCGSEMYLFFRRQSLPAVTSG